MQDLNKLINQIVNKVNQTTKYNKSILFKTIKTPLGSYLSASFHEKICFLKFINISDLYRNLIKIAKNYQAKLITEQLSPILNELENQLALYFQGKLKSFTLPLEYKGTEFQQTVWQVLKTIPYGTTISYQDQAHLLRYPTAVRAVANANGKNPISILIPCHRVIGSNGRLGGYTSGIAIKKKLLKLESIDS